MRGDDFELEAHTLTWTPHTATSLRRGYATSPCVTPPILPSWPLTTSRIYTKTSVSNMATMYTRPVDRTTSLSLVCIYICHPYFVDLIIRSCFFLCQHWTCTAGQHQHLQFLVCVLFQFSVATTVIYSTECPSSHTHSPPTHPLTPPPPTHTHTHTRADLSDKAGKLVDHSRVPEANG